MLALLVTAYYLGPTEDPRSGSVAVRLALALCLVAAATVVARRSVLRSDQPFLRAIEAVALVVSVLVVGFATVYLQTSLADTGAFSEPLDHTGSLYFTVTTLTTVGFGDITPRSDLARIAVMVQMVANVVILGVTTRFLINTAHRRSHELGEQSGSA